MFTFEELVEMFDNLDVDVLNFNDLKHTIIKQSINLVIVGPEIPLIEGVVDFK